MNKLFLATALVIAASAQAGKVDLEKSTVKWEGKKVVLGGHWGHVKIKSADISLDKKGEPTAGVVVIDLNKIEVKDDGVDAKSAPKLVGHLQSPDFFDTQKFPEASFTATSFKKISKGKYEVAGNLKIKDVTLPQKLVMAVEKDKTTTKVEGELTFDRSKFGVTYGSPTLVSVAKDKAIKDEVELDINLVLVN